MSPASIALYVVSLLACIAARGYLALGRAAWQRAHRDREHSRELLRQDVQILRLTTALCNTKKDAVDDSRKTESTQ